MIEERGIQLDIEPEEEPTTESDVFYNTDMVLNRDVSVAALQVFQEQRRRDTPMKVLDALAGSGIRGLRYWNKVNGIGEVTVNDIDPTVVENIECNIELNDAPDIQVTNKDANLLMTANRKNYDFVDIDPFGSPASFTDSAVRSLYHYGFAGFTATDLATLCGSYQKTCRRRYAAHSLNTSYCHEIGLRVLIRFLFESFARFDKVFRPKLSFARKHYYRVFGEVKESKKAVNRMVDNIGHLQHCEDCGYRNLVENPRVTECKYCEGELRLLGPMWIGKLARQNWCDKIADHLDEYGYAEAEQLVRTVREEALIKTPYYDTHRLGKYLGIAAPKREELLAAIREKGYRAVETHFAPTGIRTNAPIDQIKEMMKELSVGK
jgi:tRNA (guanine26-N2/guanine27-N2)-dimethyltransferase